MKRKPFLNFVKKVAAVVLPVAAPRVNAVVQAVEEAHAENTAPDAPAPAPKQVMQGALTYTGIAVTLLGYVIQQLGITPEGYDSTTVATVIVGLALSVYGRYRREKRA